MRVAPTIELSDAMRAELEKLARGRGTAVRLAMRAKIILLAADGLQNKELAIHEYIDSHNDRTMPYVSTSEVDTIIEKVGRARVATNTSTPE